MSRSAALHSRITDGGDGSGETTLLVRCDHAAANKQYNIGLRKSLVAMTKTSQVDREPIEIPVRYDGEDLAFVAEACSSQKKRQLNATWNYLCGAAGLPGFAYLSGLDFSFKAAAQHAPDTSSGWCRGDRSDIFGCLPARPAVGT